MFQVVDACTAFTEVRINHQFSVQGHIGLNAINHQQWLGYDDESPYIKAQDKQFGIENKLDAARKNIAPVTRGLGFSAPITVKGSNVGGAFFSFVSLVFLQTFGIIITEV